MFSEELTNTLFCSVRFQHRRSSYKELQYIRDGDSNGVLHFAGTSYGEHQWVNPVLAKVVFSLLSLLSFQIIFKIQIPCLGFKCE